MPSNYNSEQEFLAHYNQKDYPRPSVTVDNVILTMDANGKLCVLLVKRADWPFRNRWALPGGFLEAGKESAEQAAARELNEETGLSGIRLRQLATFSEPDRDPRCHAISVVYTALIPAGRLNITAGDDAADADLFRIIYDGNDLTLSCEGVPYGLIVNQSSLAFDHTRIIKTALDRLRGRIAYEPDAFELLPDKSDFTIHELRKIYEAIYGKPLDPSNFRKHFMRAWFKTGAIDTTGKFRENAGFRPAAIYRLNQPSEKKV